MCQKIAALRHGDQGFRRTAAPPEVVRGRFKDRNAAFEIADLAAQLSVGRFHAPGRTFVPFIPRMQADRQSAVIVTPYGGLHGRIAHHLLDTCLIHRKL